MRVKDFTYYPIMSDGDCAFRMKRGRGYHQCGHAGRKELGGYKFCKRHAEFVEKNAEDLQPEKK